MPLAGGERGRPAQRQAARGSVERGREADERRHGEHREERGLGVWADVLGRDDEHEPHGHAGDEREHRRAAAVLGLPGQQGEDEGQRVVDGVPRVQREAQREEEGQQQQRVATPAKPGDRGRRHGERDDQQMGDVRDPPGRRAVAGLEHAEAADDGVAV